ncbi:NAD(P)H-hydrate dehydratase [Catenovulum sediminis]|uniref:NAD(P)H-hydrate dehydratase n=1 Tax=Catenovulum sediminis TaxID=1740262 RepID=UPI00117CE710|nr:NAD(P)H-hydrate dehydratase [Catenovulum sediminis]
MKLSSNRHLPRNLYTPEQVKNSEKWAAQQQGLSLFELMQKAGEAIFELIENCFFKEKTLCILLGKGNNAGDGFVVARLAHTAGWHVELATMPGCQSWSGEAQQALAQLPDSIHFKNVESCDFSSFSVIVDAVFGIGLNKIVKPEWSVIFDAVNQAGRLVISADVPSGLNAHTGDVMGNAIKATHTVTFIALKSGLFTADAGDYCGEIHFAPLDVAQHVEKANQAYFRLLQLSEQKFYFKPRARNSHKGQFGRLLCIGGDRGMSGAIRIAAEGALRAGAGTVSVITHPDNVVQVSQGRPELMVYGVNGITTEAKTLMQQADAIVIGPGLGRSGWANGLMQIACELEQNKVVDADALHWLAEHAVKKNNWILTPHPGEAGVLLQQSSSHIQHDRYAAAQQIQARYGGVCILKGHGSLIASSQDTSVCQAGNPGMASGGMGDLLAGICGAFIAQGFAPTLAAELAVVVHAQAGDEAAKQGERGMIASDLMSFVRQCVNQAIES